MTIIPIRSEEELRKQRTQVLSRLCNLPVFSPVALKLLGLSIESDDAFAEFEKVFKSDPALTGELLLCANSAEFGLRGRVNNIRHALTIIGLERTRSLAFTIAMHLYMRNVGRQLDVTSTWSHSMATAILAEHIESAYQIPATLSYTAGLIHDLGRLGLMVSSKQRYLDLLGQDFRDIESVMEQEKSVLGVTHTEAGAFLAQVWGFPDDLRSCVCYHHSPPAADGRDLLCRIQMSCRLADSLGYQETPIDYRYDPEEVLPQDLRKRKEFAPDALRDLIRKRMAQLW